jgi:hypothetical protein
MTNNTTTVLLRAQVDQSTAEQGVRALRAVQQASDDAQKSLLKINEDAGKVSSEFQRLAAVSQTIGRDSAIHDLAGQFVELGKATGDYEQQLINLRRALREVGASDEELAKATRAFKELQNEAENTQKNFDLGGLSSLRGVGRAAGQLGLPGAQEIQKVGDLGIIIKQLTAASESAGTSILATTVSIGGLEVALGPLLLVVGAVALAILDLKGILDLIKKSTDDAVAAQKAKFDEDQKQDQQRKDNRQAGRTTSAQQNQQFVDDTFGDAQDLQKRINDKKTEIAQNQKDYDALGASFNPFERNRLKGVRDELDKELNTLQQQQNDTFSQSENAAKNIQPLIDQNDKLKRAQDELLKSADDLIHKREQEQQFLQLTGTAAQQRLEQLKAEQSGVEAARDQLAKSGDTSQAVKDKLAEYNKTLADNAQAQKYLTDTAIPLIKTREDEAAAIKKQDEAFKSYTDALSKAGEATSAVASLQVQRSSQVKQEAEDDARDAKRAATEKDYQTRIAAAKEAESIKAVRDKLEQDDEAAQTKAAQSRSKINQTLFDAELKAYAEYIEAEKDQTNRANKQRLRTLEDAQGDLRKLAAAGDVAGFIERSDQAKKDLRRQQEDNTEAQQKLQADYEKQINTARDARTKQLQDLEVSFRQEADARQVSAQQRIQEIQNTGKIANSRAAQLEQELNNIRAQWRRDDLTRQRAAEQQSYQERLAVQIAAQNQALQAEQLFWSNFQNVLNGNPAAPSATSSGHSTQVIPQYEGGIDYVQTRHLAYLDPGERVLTARQNVDYTSGRSGGGIVIQKIEVNATVGDVATKSFVEQTADVIVEGVKLAHQQSKGRSSNS